MASTDVKQGDRVVYAIGDVEYNGVALGTVTTGVHPGHKRASKHLNLIYLNEQGTPVKIFGAPLLTSAETIEDKAAFAQMNARIERQAPDGHELRTVEGQVKAKEESPRKIGWRPFVDGEDVAKLANQVSNLRQTVSELDAENAKLRSEKTALAAQVNPAPVSDDGPGIPSAADLDAAAAEQAAAAATE